MSNNPKAWHRVRVDVFVDAQGTARAPFPTYSDLTYEGAEAWIDVPPADCPCAYADAVAHAAALAVRYPSLTLEAVARCTISGHVVTGAGPRVDHVPAGAPAFAIAAKAAAQAGEPARLREAAFVAARTRPAADQPREMDGT